MENQNHFEIKLYGKNPDSDKSFALVSTNKVSYVIDHKWYLGKNGYPFTYINGARVQLHKYVWHLNNGSLPDQNLYIDHVNRNKLDATDSNLRLATPAENSYNKTPISKIMDPMTNSPLHHIKWKKSGYVVSITKENQTNTIDQIATLEDAKNVYNMMATEMFGKFAVLYEN